MKHNSFINRNQDLINNPNPRLSICLCLDTSASMNGAPIKALNEGVNLFYETLRKDLVASGVAEVTVVTFGANGVRMHADFEGLQRVTTVPQFSTGGNAPMGEAINLSLDKLHQRRCEYRQNGVEYYKPWLVLMTDGDNNGSSREFERARQRVADMCNSNCLDFLPIAVGNKVNMAKLNSISSKHRTMKLKGICFREFFAWLSRSVSSVSCSMPGQERPLHTFAVESWSTL